MTPAELIEKCDKHDEFVQFEDGFVYYWPVGRGGISAVHLRIIADELDRRNAAWEKDLADYFNSDSSDKH